MIYALSDKDEVISQSRESIRKDRFKHCRLEHVVSVFVAFVFVTILQALLIGRSQKCCLLLYHYWLLLVATILYGAKWRISCKQRTTLLRFTDSIILARKTKHITLLQNWKNDSSMLPKNWVSKLRGLSSDTIEFLCKYSMHLWPQFYVPRIV